jgi:hypothetical protein
MREIRPSGSEGGGAISALPTPIGGKMGEIITRGKLPHWYVPHAAHFVTYRLAQVQYLTF